MTLPPPPPRNFCSNSVFSIIPNKLRLMALSTQTFFLFVSIFHCGKFCVGYISYGFKCCCHRRHSVGSTSVSLGCRRDIRPLVHFVSARRVRHTTVVRMVWVFFRCTPHNRKLIAAQRGDRPQHTLMHAHTHTLIHSHPEFQP